jgi:hypothetical protein
MQVKDSWKTASTKRSHSESYCFTKTGDETPHVKDTLPTLEDKAIFLSSRLRSCDGGNAIKTLLK